MKLLIRVSAGIGLAAVVVAILFVWAFVGDDTKVLAAADTLSVPNNWTLITEEVTPDYRVCLNGGSCPEVRRVWETPFVVTADDLDTILTESGLESAIDGDCSHSCSGDGRVGAFTLRVTIGAPEPARKGGEVTLFVW